MREKKAKEKEKKRKKLVEVRKIKKGEILRKVRVKIWLERIDM